MHHDPDEQIPFDAPLPTSSVRPVRFPRDIVVLGRALRFDVRGSKGEIHFWYQHPYSCGDAPGIQLAVRESSIALNVSSGTGNHSIGARVEAPVSLADAEQAWLEYASLEAPRLCALVVDGMQPKAA